MRPVALALLAGLVAVALFQIFVWQDDGDLEAVLDEPGGTQAEAPRDRVGSDLLAATPDLTAAVHSPDRKQIGTAKVRVTGQLIGPKGAAVVGTRMHLHLGSMVANPFLGFNPFGSATKAPAAVTQTDGEGRFAFDVPVKKVGYIALGSGDLVWKNKPPRFLGSEVNLNLGELTVHMGAVLRGRVISEYDAPIEDVTLRCISYEHFGSRRNTKSDRNGNFELRGLPGGLAYLTITRQGYVGLQKLTEMELGKTRDGMVVRLRRGDALMGFVVDDQSKPIEGATIHARGNGRSIGDGGYEYSN